MREKLKQIRLLKGIVMRLRLIRLFVFGGRPEPLTEETPWITPKAIDFLKNHLRKDMIAFEWGSGGSTPFIARRVKSLITVEHNFEWYTRVKMYLLLAGIRNCKMILKEKNATDFDDGIRWAEKEYKNFCREIFKYDDNHFDLIFIDDRSRMNCLLFAMKKVKIGGYIVLDDSQQEDHQWGITEFMDSGMFTRQDFWGFPMNLKTEQSTTVFTRIK